MEKPADHWFIGCRVTKNGAPLPQEEKKTTIIETVNSRKVQQEIELTSWDNFKHIEDPEEMYRSIVSTFNNIYEKSKRVYEKGEKDFQTPWVNQELRTEIHKKMTLLKQWRNSKKNPILYDLYTKQRNVVKNGIKKAKRKYLFRLFKQADGNMKKLWSLINQCMNRKIREPADEMLKKNFQTDDLLSLSNQFNTDFLKKIKDLKEENKGNIMEVDLKEHQLHGDLTSMYLGMAKEKEIDKIIMGLNKTGPGLDGIRLEDFRKNRTLFTPILTQLVNKMITAAAIPDELKVSCVTPIYKKGTVNLVSNYRPVGSMPVVEKILEKYLNMKTKKYLTENAIIPDFQHGFQEKKSTSTLLEEFSELINGALDNQKYIVVILADLTAAFDGIEHEILLKKFKEIGISHPIFTEYFRNRKQLTKIGKTKSNEENIEHGLIQGGINSPTWYNVYTYDTKYLNIRSHLKMFADDSCLISIHKDPNIAVQKVQTDLMTLQKYFYNNSIFFNSKKTEVLLLGPNRAAPVEVNQIYSHTRTCLENNQHGNCNCPPLEYTNEARYLGVIIDSKFKMKEHVLQLTKKLRVLHYNFNRMNANCLPMSTKKIIYYSLVESLLRYGVTVYTFCPNYCLTPLNNVQKKIKKYLFKKKKEMTVMTPQQLSNFINICNHFFEDKYRRTIEVTYPLRHTQQYLKYRPYTKYGERKLDYQIPSLLEKYCKNFLNEENPNIVKKKVKEKIFGDQQQ
ncbi:hypothetical protein M8J77_002599 [Diaphorina citri]|nr:hypothetical protein M8J77_002599 [Diaphorina citri]